MSAYRVHTLLAVSLGRGRHLRLDLLHAIRPPGPRPAAPLQLVVGDRASRRRR